MFCTLHMYAAAPLVHFEHHHQPRLLVLHSTWPCGQPFIGEGVEAPKGYCPAGTLPPSWAALTAMQACYIYNNSLSGPLPSPWSKLAVQLEKLALHYNALTGGSWRPWLVLLMPAWFVCCLPAETTATSA